MYAPVFSPRSPGPGAMKTVAEVRGSGLAIDETVILPHPPLLLVVGVSLGMERERQQNDSLANG